MMQSRRESSSLRLSQMLSDDDPGGRGGTAETAEDPPFYATEEEDDPPASWVWLTRLAPDGPLIPVADRPDADDPPSDASRAGADADADADEDAATGVKDDRGRGRAFGRIRRKSDRYHQMKRSRELATYPADSYSFLAIHGPLAHPPFFLFGLGVWICQMLFLVLMLVSMVVPRFRVGQNDNPTDSLLGSFIPSNVSVQTHVVQMVALVTYCIFSDSSMADCVKAVEMFPRLDRERENDPIYPSMFSCVLRMIQGLTATVVTTLLILTTADVVEIILNFTAVNYISNLDEVAFNLAKDGKYGPRLEEEAKSIEKRMVPYSLYRKHRHKRHQYVVFPICVAMLVIFFVVTGNQLSDTSWVTQELRVEFRDQALREYSGCYQVDHDTKSAHRHHYNGHSNNSAAFAYCEDHHHWVLFENEGDGNNDGVITSDPCVAKELVYSADVDTFDIWSSFDELWFSATGQPLNLYFIEEGEDLHCDSFQHDGTCNPFFNTEKHGFDGGDCCAFTCKHASCGVDGITEAFGVEGKGGNGYPVCKDPDMATLTILLTGIRSSREEVFLDVTDAQKEKYERDRGINFLREPPNPAYFIVDCDQDNSLSASLEKKVNVLSINVDKSMENQTEIIKVPDGARCQISVSNTVNFVNKWDDDPIWFVNYTVYHGEGTDIEIISGDSSKEQSAAFHRIPECYLTKFKEWMNIPDPYDLNKLPAKALKWIVEDNDVSGNSQCDDQFLVERAALSALNFAAPVASARNEEQFALSALNYVQFALSALNYVTPIASATNENDDTLWIDEQQQCGWKNIACNNGFVTSLTLKDIGLSGTISTAIGWLHELQQAYFDNNDLFGTLPSEIGILTKLRVFEVDHNALTGTIPTELGNLINIVELDLDDNKLTGTIPTEFGTMINARELDLVYNQLSGPIPTEIGNLLRMTMLELTNNIMTGTLPTQLGQLTKLEQLKLNKNAFTGFIPTEIGLMTSLSSIDLRGNSLTGPIPSEIGLITHLTEIRLEGNNFTGTLPDEVASLERLEILTFDSSLTGYAPGNVKTLLPCVLCNGTSYKLKYSSINTVNSDIRSVSCDMLLEKQQDIKSPFSFNECEILKKTCIACTTSNVFSL